MTHTPPRSNLPPPPAVFVFDPQEGPHLTVRCGIASSPPPLPCTCVCCSFVMYIVFYMTHYSFPTPTFSFFFVSTCTTMCVSFPPSLRHFIEPPHSPTHSRPHKGGESPQPNRALPPRRSAWRRTRWPRCCGTAPSALRFAWAGDPHTFPSPPPPARVQPSCSLTPPPPKRGHVAISLERILHSQGDGPLLGPQGFD